MDLHPISSVQTQDTAQRTCQERWMIRKDGERERERERERESERERERKSGDYMLSVWLDDDDDWKY